ncbi:MAG TPA: DUF1735 domain-containing protein [Candidatus Alistipes intestinipullorum]|nr:DUF1735 domain-containing protein [Candidatus Alistipes intestinipullorum]
MNNRIVYGVLAGIALVMLGSCENWDQDFPDFKYTATYFPYQYPARVLILGEDEQVDTTPDNNGEFRIGLTMAGAYSNDRDRRVEYVIDESLAENLSTSTGVKLEALPHSYYNFHESGALTIPKGSMQGYMDIKLTDEFFADAASKDLRYVIPVRIISAQTDSVLFGRPAHPDADRRIATDWYVAPMDFTIYAIRYINPWHGKYLYRGQDEYGDGKKVIYRNKYVEKCELADITTLSKNQALFETQVRNIDGNSPGKISLVLTFDDDGKCAVTSNESSYAVVTGTGEFVKDGDKWGGKKRNVLHLSYSYTDPATSELHMVKDTLVVRDRNVKLETYSPVVE